MRKVWEYISLKGNVAISTKQMITATAFVLGLFHVVLWFFYCAFGVKEMMIWNGLSILVYITCYMGALKGEYLRRIFDVIFLEIIIHAILATIYLGIDCGFMLYLIAVIPIGYYVAYSFRELNQNVNPMFYVITSIVTFWITRVVCRLIEPKYSLGNIVIDRFVYIFNYTAIAIGIVAFCSTMVGKVIYLEAKQSMQNKALEELSKHDPLTGLFNRRSIQERYENAEKMDEKYAVVLGDIDDFKKVNDTHGHDIGDEVLKAVADVYKSTTRGDDIVCRWGGEEILVFIPGASKEQAVEVAKRVLEGVRALEILSKDKEKFKITMTIGVAASDEGKSFNEIVRRADERLYAGKHAGKNRIVSKDI